MNADAKPMQAMVADTLFQGALPGLLSGTSASLAVTPQCYARSAGKKKSSRGLLRTVSGYEA
eukprot:5052892-Amphidinium_carterae.1